MNFCKTAAHCLEVQQGFKLSSVRLGQADLGGPGGMEVNISEILPHPQFTNDPVALFDVAILQLDRRVEFSNLVQPICLPSPPTPSFQEPGAPSPASVGNNRARSSVAGGEDLNEIKQCIVTGWGRTESAWSSQSLRYTHLATIHNSECSNYYNRALIEGRLGPLASFDILDNQLCATGKKKTDSCSGDSGGPLFYENDEGRSFLVGVVSFGTVTCDSSLPGVYTRISSFVPWIYDTIDNDLVSR